MSAAVAFNVLAALRQLRDVCTGMEAEHEGMRPAEADYQRALASATAAIDKATAQIAITDFVAYGAALKRDCLTSCIEIEKRWGLFGYPPEIVSVGLTAAAEGRDMDLALTAYMQPEVTS